MLPECEESEITCTISQTCLPQQLYGCNTFPNCNEGEDEANCPNNNKNDTKREIFIEPDIDIGKGGKGPADGEHFTISVL